MQQKNDMTCLINLQDMEFYAYHGCFEAEKKVGNRFIVNAWLEYDSTKAASTDNIKDALNYQTAYEVIAEQMSKASSLLENVCQRIIDALFEKFPEQLTVAQVDVAKMAPPMGGKMRSVTVTLRREKDEEDASVLSEEETSASIQATMFSSPSC